jgi:hypothetical protein
MLKLVLFKSLIKLPLEVGVDDTEGALKRDTKVEVPPVNIS